MIFPFWLFCSEQFLKEKHIEENWEKLFTKISRKEEKKSFSQKFAFQRWKDTIFELFYFHMFLREQKKSSFVKSFLTNLCVLFLKVCWNWRKEKWRRSFPVWLGKRSVCKLSGKKDRGKSGSFLLQISVCMKSPKIFFFETLGKAKISCFLKFSKFASENLRKSFINPFILSNLALWIFIEGQNTRSEKKAPNRWFKKGFF